MHEALGFASHQVPLEVWLRARLAQLPSASLTEASQHLARCEAVTSEPEEWRGLSGEVLLARAVVDARSGEPSAGRALDGAVATFTAYRLPWRLSAARALQRDLNIEAPQSDYEHDDGSPD
jgi:hypothetical protein